MAGEQEIAVVLRLIADEFKKELSSSKGVLGDFMGALRTWQAQVSAGAGILLAFAKSTASYAEETKNAAIATGTTAQGFQALSYAAKQSNVDQDTLRAGLVNLNRSLVEAYQKSGDARDAFGGLGVSVRAADGSLRFTDETLMELADRFQALGPGAESTAYAVKLFGKAGSEMLPFLMEGRDSIGAMVQRAKELGIVLGDEALADASAFNNALDEMTAAMNGLKLTVGNAVIPVFTALFKTLSDLLAGPFGDGLKLVLKGWREIFVVVQGATQSVEALLDRIAGKIDQTQLLEKLQKIREDTGASLYFLDNPDAQVQVKKGTSRGPTTLDSDVREKQAALERERAYAEQLISVRREMQEAYLLVEEANLQRMSETQALGGEELIAEQATLERRKLEVRQESYTKLLQVESLFAQELKAIRGRSHEEQEKAEAEHELKVMKIVGDMYAVRQQLSIQNAKTGQALEKVRGLDEQGKGTAQRYNDGQDYQKAKQGIANYIATEQAALATLEASSTASFYELADTRIRILQGMRERDLFEETTNEATRAKISAEYDLKITQEHRAITQHRLEDELAQAVEHLEYVKSFYTSTSTEIAEAQLAVFAAMRERDLADVRLSEAQKERIQTEYEAKEKRERAKMDSLSGLAQGMTDYIRDTDTAFGMMRDMARSTAQAMQGFFSKFFFDLLEGKITSLKDLMKGVLDFVRTIIVQVAAQLATIMALKLMVGGATGGVGLLGGLFARDGGEVFKKYRLGGPIISNGDHIPIMAARGEYVMSRRGVEFLDRINQGILPAGGGGGNVTVNVHGMEPHQRVTARHSLNLKEHVVNLIIENMSENGALRGRFA